MYFVIFLSNRVSSIEHHLTAKSQQVQKLNILKTEELHWKQKNSIRKSTLLLLVASEAMDDQ
jgi:hypothetical protein